VHFKVGSKPLKKKYNEWPQKTYPEFKTKVTLSALKNEQISTTVIFYIGVTRHLSVYGASGYTQ
jgi:hypothetical protein